MPYFRARVHDGKVESVIEEKFKDEASLREQLPKRGWATILSVEEISEPTAAAPPAEKPSPPIRADQIRESGGWVYLPQELAEKHPLHGIGGWTGLLLAILILGGLFGVWFLIQLADLLDDGGLALGFFIALLVQEILVFSAIVLVIMRSPAFPPLFVVICVVGIALRLAQFGLLGDYSGTNIGGLLNMIVWLSYVLMSRRVNVTFRHRVEREDDWLKQGLAASGAPALAPARP